MEKEFDCVYGCSYTPDTVYVYDGWYVVHGSVNVNYACPSTVWQDGINVETIEDLDCFTWSSPIESLEQLIEAVES